jgi:hypothetical protein
VLLGAAVACWGLTQVVDDGSIGVFNSTNNATSDVDASAPDDDARGTDKTCLQYDACAAQHEEADCLAEAAGCSWVQHDAFPSICIRNIDGGQVDLGVDTAPPPLTVRLKACDCTISGWPLAATGCCFNFLLQTSTAQSYRPWIAALLFDIVLFGLQCAIGSSDDDFV